MSEQRIVPAKTSDVLQALENAGMARRELIRYAQGSLRPVVHLEVSGCKAETVSRVSVDVKSGHREMACVKQGQQTAQQTGMVDREAGTRPALNRLMLDNQPQDIAGFLDAHVRMFLPFMANQEIMD